MGRGQNDLIMIDEPELSLWLQRQQSLLDDLRKLLHLNIDSEHKRFDSTMRNWMKMRQHPEQRDIEQPEFDTSNVSPLSLAPRHLIVASHSPYVKGVRDVFHPITEQEQ